MELSLRCSAASLLLIAALSDGFGQTF